MPSRRPREILCAPPWPMDSAMPPLGCTYCTAMIHPSMWGIHPSSLCLPCRAPLLLRSAAASSESFLATLRGLCCLCCLASPISSRLVAHSAAVLSSSSSAPLLSVPCHLCSRGRHFSCKLLISFRTTVIRGSPAGTDSISQCLEEERWFAFVSADVRAQVWAACNRLTAVV